MKELSIPKGVYTSTLAVFGDTKGELVDESYRMKGSPLSVYDRTKWSAHHEVAEPAMRSGLPLVIVQPGLVYGPGDTSDAGVMLRDYLQRKLRGVPRGVAYCWGHIEDTARGHILAMDKGKVGESYIIAGPKHTVIEALEVAERLTGIPAPRFHPGPRFMRFLSRGARLLGNRAATERLRVLAGATYLGSNAKAREHLGFDPRSLEAGLRETLEHEMGALGIRPRASS
jgi:nucleoside-diphosphate-sugar epimerase